MSGNGGPAFPSHGSMGEVVQHGQSLRDYFAGQALAGVIAGKWNVLSWKEVAEGCYNAAEAMLAERAIREQRDRTG